MHVVNHGWWRAAIPQPTCLPRPVVQSQETKHRACVVYGALPPETRRQQAKLFNEPDNAYRVMVASDAVSPAWGGTACAGATAACHAVAAAASPIAETYLRLPDQHAQVGMGLNLNIRRVIFHAVTKFEGERPRPSELGGSAQQQNADVVHSLGVQHALRLRTDQLSCLGGWPATVPQFFGSSPTHPLALSVLPRRQGQRARERKHAQADCGARGAAQQPVARGPGHMP